MYVWSQHDTRDNYLTRIPCFSFRIIKAVLKEAKMTERLMGVSRMRFLILPALPIWCSRALAHFISRWESLAFIWGRLNFNVFVDHKFKLFRPHPLWLCCTCWMLQRFWHWLPTLSYKHSSVTWKCQTLNVFQPTFLFSYVMQPFLFPVLNATCITYDTHFLSRRFFCYTQIYKNITLSQIQLRFLVFLFFVFAKVHVTVTDLLSGTKKK